MHSVVCAAIYIVYYTEMQNVTDLYQFNAIFSNCAKVLNLHAFLQVKFGFKRMCNVHMPLVLDIFMHTGDGRGWCR